jgi:small ligand-binding sensory domain FIST
MRASAALVLGAGPDEAATRAAEQALGALGGQVPSLAVLFITQQYSSRAELLLGAVRSVVGSVPLIGCLAGSVVGGGREVESEAAVSLWLAADAGPVETFSMGYMKARGGGLYGGYRFNEGGGLHLLICDPYTFPAAELLEHLNRNVPGTVIAGGMAGVGSSRRRPHLFLDGRALDGGAVGVNLPGARADLVVAQGCRPIGSPYTVTRAEGNVMHELGGRPPLQRLKDIVAALPERDRELLANGGLQLGRVIDEYRAEQRPGDFLVRSVVGADAQTGSIVVGDEVEVGQTVQFHLRDAASADEDLRDALEREVTTLSGREATGALLFTCNGRGSRLFSGPDHDAGLVTKFLGDIPVAGFSCAGELGPVGGKNFLHGFTASVAVFR